MLIDALTDRSLTWLTTEQPACRTRPKDRPDRLTECSLLLPEQRAHNPAVVSGVHQPVPSVSPAAGGDEGTNPSKPYRPPRAASPLPLLVPRDQQYQSSER